jgi:mono/diheme cytochrome c family protein
MRRLSPSKQGGHGEPKLGSCTSGRGGAGARDCRGHEFARARRRRIDDALSTAGKVWYEKYCMPCHGQGGAPGDAVYRATKERVNLRTYVQRHGGKFPANDWLAVIADIKRHPRRAALSSSEDDAAVSRP